MASDLKTSATQEKEDSQEVARLLAAGKKVTDPQLRQRILREPTKSARRFSTSMARWSGLWI